MKKFLPIFLILTACGGGSDDQAEDNRICIVTDSFNDNSDNSVTEQAEEAGIEAKAQGAQISLCGASTDIDTAISNAAAPELSDALATGRRVK